MTSRVLSFALTGLAALLLLAFGVSGPVASAPNRGPSSGEDAVDPSSVPAADHHVHIFSPASREIGIRIQKALGEEVVAEEKIRILSADEVIARLDSAGIEQGVLLSVAYFFAVPDISVEDERARVQAENDHVARLVSAHPERLVGFFSVNPLSDYALDEIERLAGHEAFAGIKLHLGNSDVDLRDPEDVARLREVLARVNELGLAVVIHLGGRSDSFGAPDAKAFVDEVLPSAPDVPIQVAHMAGPGGLGPGTRASSGVFAAALEQYPERTRNLVFDLSGVPHPRYLAQGDTALVRRIDALNRAFVDVARELGFDRIVYGSDYPAVSMPRYLKGLRQDLPLSEEEFRDLVDDRAPYLE